MRRFVPAIAVLAAAVTACSSTPQAASPDQASPSAPAAHPSPTVLRFGQPAVGTGEGGKKLQLTPLGVVYNKGGDAASGLAPTNGTFVAVAIKVVAEDDGDHVPPPISGKGFMWRGSDGEMNDPDSGPWSGSVNDFTSTHDFQPGEPEIAYITFDVPARGGTLTYISPDGSRARWSIPRAQGGKGLAQILRQVKYLGLTS